MINICGQCDYQHIKLIKCAMCSGNPKFVDNFKQKPPPPIKYNPNYKDTGDWIGRNKKR